MLPTGDYDGSHLINSGVLGRGQSFSLTFSKTGSFPYLCALHERVMRAVVEVVEPGTTGITTQQEADAMAAAHMPQHLLELDEIMTTRNTARQDEAADGASTWHVRAGTTGSSGHLHIDAFLPERLNVRQGDTVTWKVDHDVPHTVTFPEPGAPPIEILAVMLPDGTMVTPGDGPARPLRSAAHRQH